MRRKIDKTCIVNIPPHRLLLRNLVHALYINLANCTCMDRILWWWRWPPCQNLGDTLKHHWMTAGWEPCSRAQPQTLLEAKKGAGNPILAGKSDPPGCNLCTDPPVYEHKIPTDHWLCHLLHKKYSQYWSLNLGKSHFPKLFFPPF